MWQIAQKEMRPPRLYRRDEMRIAGRELRSDLQGDGDGTIFGDIIRDYVNDFGGEASRVGGVENSENLRDFYKDILLKDGHNPEAPG